MIAFGLLKAFRRELVAVALLVIPPLLLIPLGGLWLLERGGTLAFLATALGCAVIAGLIMLAGKRKSPAAHTEAIETPADWPERERAAFEKVERFTRETSALSFASQAEAIDLAHRTVDIVARHYRPDAASPLTAFTMPEALLSLESVAGRLRRGLLLAVPLSDRLTVSQLLWLSASAEKAGRLGETVQSIYNLYRIARPVISPAGSVMAEVRGLIQEELLTSAKSGLKNRLTRLLVIEVGRAAVELYSGRMRLDPAELANAAAAAAREGDAKPPSSPAPLRLLIAGQTNAGKSSLINALARSIVAQVTPVPGPAGFGCFEAVDPAGQTCILVDAPGLSAAPAAVEALVAEAVKADAMLWTVSALQAARDTDVRGLRGFRAAFEQRSDLNRPPLLCVVTHVDQLRPFAEWEPPYDVAAPSGPKARSIRDAMDAIALDLGMPIGSVVPVSLAPDHDAYNVDALRLRISESLPAARHAQLSRTYARHKRGGWWRDVERLYQGAKTIVWPYPGTE
nr:GTPase [uncultured Rhodopila sp.]